MSNVTLNNIIVKQNLGHCIHRNHCIASASLFRNGREFANLVIDHYTPKKAEAGYYAAFRSPGYTERQHPRLRVFLGHDPYSLNLLAVDLLAHVAQEWSDLFDPESKRLMFVRDARLEGLIG